MWFNFKKEDIKYFNEISDFPENTYGFIYKIIHKESKRYYIGKKVLYHNIKKKLTKKELLEQTGPGRRPTTKLIQKESDWLNYWGSSKDFLEFKKGKLDTEFSREILYIVSNKKLLTYYECKYQFVYNVLESDEWLNTNILGKFYSKDFVA